MKQQYGRAELYRACEPVFERTDRAVKTVYICESFQDDFFWFFLRQGKNEQ